VGTVKCKRDDINEAKQTNKGHDQQTRATMKQRRIKNRRKTKTMRVRIDGAKARWIEKQARENGLSYSRAADLLLERLQSSYCKSLQKCGDLESRLQAYDLWLPQSQKDMINARWEESGRLASILLGKINHAAP
jgi:hypothetical protein